MEPAPPGCIGADVGVMLLPTPEVPEKEVTVDAVGKGSAQRDEVIWVELEFGSELYRDDVVRCEAGTAATCRADRVLREKAAADIGPRAGAMNGGIIAPTVRRKERAEHGSGAGVWRYFGPANICEDLGFRGGAKLIPAAPKLCVPDLDLAVAQGEDEAHVEGL